MILEKLNADDTWSKAADIDTTHGIYFGMAAVFPKREDQFVGVGTVANYRYVYSAAEKDALFAEMAQDWGPNPHDPNIGGVRVVEATT